MQHVHAASASWVRWFPSLAGNCPAASIVSPLFPLSSSPASVCVERRGVVQTCASGHGVALKLAASNAVVEEIALLLLCVLVGEGKLGNECQAAA